MAREQISPNTANYMRGGTRVYVKRDTDTGFIHLGNIVSATIARNEDVQEHITGMDGSKVVDRTRMDVKSIDYTVQTDENTIENVRAWLLGGTRTGDTTVAAVPDCVVTWSVNSLDDILVDSGIDGAPVTTLVGGRWYDLTHATPGRIRNIATLVMTGKTEDEDPTTGYKLDYESGKIMFYAASTTASAVTITAMSTAASKKNTFASFADLQIDCVAEGVHSFEDGDIRDFWTVPDAQLTPSGDGAVSIENDRVLEFKLSQLYHATLGWGTYERVDLGA